MIRPTKIVVLLALLFVNDAANGATCQRIDSIPLDAVPQSVLRQPRAETQPEVSHLRLTKPAKYTLDAGDTLAIFVEGVIGDLDSNPPVQIPPAGSALPPAIGFPVPVRENGQIELPHVGALTVKGMTVQQVENLLKQKYIGGEQPILRANNRILVSLLRERTYRVTVIRQDVDFQRSARSARTSRQQSQGINQRTDLSSQGTILQLPANQNDVLNALIRTGGLPGVNAESSVRVQKANANRAVGVAPAAASVSFGNREFPRSGTRSTSSRQRAFRPSYSNSDARVYGSSRRSTGRSGASYSVPTRSSGGTNSNIRPQDITLNDGDIVHVDARSAAVYYTGGLLNAGERPLPRDTDLDVLEAVSIAGGSVGAGGRGVPPSELIVLRKLPGNRQVAIRVDLNRAINDPRERILVAPGDTLLLRRKASEQIGNFGSRVLNSVGGQLIRQ